MKKLLFLFCYLLFNSLANAQSSKKETLSFFKSISKLDTNKIKEGKHPELARTFSIEEFIVYYLEKGKLRVTKDMGWLSIASFYRDSLSTYFVRKNNFVIVDFFKVNTNDLVESKYEQFDDELLREKFIAEIVPESDKAKVKRNSGNDIMCYNSNFRFAYNHSSRYVTVSYKWNLKSAFINKAYKADYDIGSKQFVNGRRNSID